MRGSPRIAQLVVGLVVAVTVAAASSASGESTTLAFEEGADYADAEAEGWASGFATRDNGTSFDLTVTGLPGARVTIDDLVTIDRTSGSGSFQVNVTEPLTGEANLTIRFWSGQTPPTTDGASSVCVVADLSTSGVADGSCSAETVHLQYLITLPEGHQGSIDYGFDLLDTETTGSTAGGGGGGGGGGARLAESVSTVASPEPTASGTVERYVTKDTALDEGGELDVAFPATETRVRGVTMTVEEACEATHLTVDHLPTIPRGEALPRDLREIDAVAIRPACEDRILAVGSVRGNLSLFVAASELAFDEDPGKAHAFSWDASTATWRHATPTRLTDPTGPMRVPVTGPHLIGIAVDRAPPTVDVAPMEGTDLETPTRGLAIRPHDNVALARVEVRLDGELVAERTAPPFDLTVSAADPSPTPRRVEVTVVDASGYRATRVLEAPMLPDTTPPTVEMALDPPGPRGPLGVSIDARDDVIVDRVEIYLDGTLIGTLTEPPYDLTHNRKLDPGLHRVHADAYDAAGNLARSERVFTATSADAPATPTGQQSDASTDGPSAGMIVGAAAIVFTVGSGLWLARARLPR